MGPTTRPWDSEPVLASPALVVLSVSEPSSTVRTKMTPATSATLSTTRLRTDLLCSLIQTTNLERLRLPGALKRQLSQWSGPARHFLRLNRSAFVTRRRSIRRANHNLD